MFESRVFGALQYHCAITINNLLPLIQTHTRVYSSLDELAVTDDNFTVRCGLADRDPTLRGQGQDLEKSSRRTHFIAGGWAKHISEGGGVGVPQLIVDLSHDLHNRTW